MLGSLRVANGEVIHQYGRSRSSDLSDVSPLLILILHFSSTHLLLEFLLQEVDFELEFILNLLVLCLLFDPEIRLLFQFIFILPL